MAERKVIQIEVDTKNAVKSMDNLADSNRDVSKTFAEVYGEIQPLTTRMGEAEDRLYELASAGQTASQEYKDLLAVTGQYLRTQMQTDLAVDAAATTMNQKLGGALTGVSSGFTLVQGVMGAFGTQSKEVEQALLKVQSAMAIQQGIQGIRDSMASFAQLKLAVVSAITGITTAKVAETTATEAGVVAENQNLVARGKNLALMAAQSVLTPILTAAQYAYNLALSLNPIGAIIAGVVALIAAGYGLITMFQKSSAINENAAKATAKNTKALEAQIKANEKASTALKTKNTHEYNMAKASGASADALHKLAIRHANEEIALERASLATAKNTLIKEKNTLAYLRNVDASDDVIKKQAELVKKANENSIKENADLQKALQNKAQLIRDNEVRLVEEKTKGSEKQAKTESKSNERSSTNSKNSAKEKIDITKITEDERIRLMDDGQAKEEAVLKLAYLRKKEEQDKQLKEKTLKQADYDTLQKLNTEGQEADLLAIKEKYQQKDLENFTSATFKEQKLLDEDYAKKVLALEGNELLLLQLHKEYDKKTDELELAKQQKIASEKQRLNELTKTEDQLKLIKLEADYIAEQKLYEDNAEILKALKKKYDEDVIKTTEETTQKQKELDRAVTEKKIQLTTDAFSVINDLFEMNAGKSEKDARKAFKINKAFNLATAIANSYLAVSSALTSTTPISFPGQRFVEAGLAGAAGAVQVAKIAKTQFESSGSTGGGNGGGTTAPTMSAPQFNVVGQSGINQLASLNQQPIQAYVVSGQVTSQQALDRNRLENATLGG